MTHDVKTFSIRLIVAIFALAALAIPSFADDWEVKKLRGDVFAWDGAEWQELERGSVISDNRVVRTSQFGRAEFVRDAETIEMGPNTQIRIFDRNGEKFTIVQQHFGSTAIEAEKRDVKHFAVQTPYLAAVVKGTRFEVSTRGQSSDVGVTRGSVEVRDTVHKQMTQIGAGQSASSGSSSNLSVAGRGTLPQVVAFEGNPNAISVKPSQEIVAAAQEQGAAKAADAKDNAGQVRKAATSAGTGGNASQKSSSGNSGNSGSASAASNSGNSGGNGNAGGSGNSGSNSSSNASSASSNGNGNSGSNGKGKGLVGALVDAVL